MKNYLGNSTNKRNTDYLVKNTTASNVFYIVLAFRFAITEIASTMIKLRIRVLATIMLVLSSKLNANGSACMWREFAKGFKAYFALKTESKDSTHRILHKF